jgi:RimJ/RimL family protein N-acetyltransferase
MRTFISTPRLLLRNWTESDFEPFVDMCADPEVMKYFPSTLNREESHALAIKLKSLIDNRGWGAWAVEIPNQQKIFFLDKLIALRPPHLP